jgi:hypothetical protein
MISLSNLGEFAHHQWIFLTDYFGVDLTVPESTVEMRELFTKRPECSHLPNSVREIVRIEGSSETTPFIYRPYMLNYLPQCSIDYVAKDKGKEVKTEYQARKRLIVVKDSFIRDENELKVNALFLMQYLVKLNEERTEVDWK